MTDYMVILLLGEIHKAYYDYYSLYKLVITLRKVMLLPEVTMRMCDYLNIQ